MADGRLHWRAWSRVLVAGLGWLAGWARLAAACAVCGGPLGETHYQARDRWTDENRFLCTACAVAPDRCSICGLAAGPGALALEDGRFLCARELGLVARDEAEAGQVLEATRQELDRAFARFTRFPSTNVDVQLVDQVHMRMLVNSPGFDRQCPSLVGYVRSARDGAGGWRHEVRVLTGLPRSQTRAVFAHELGHAWVRENVGPGRRLHRDAEEGFCELVAWRLMEAMGDEDQAARLLRNNYTRGEVDLFVRGCQTYEYAAVQDWMQWGQDERLVAGDPDGIRSLVPGSGRGGVGLVLPGVDPSRVVRAPSPDKLTYRGMLGVGTNRRVMVNDALLGAGETGPVRVGTNTVMIRCVEVRAGLAVFEVGAGRERVELVLPE